jgi:tRNA(Ile2) C34 agmatinyltransferase TiaS
MKVTCDRCGCNMKITSSFRYHCPNCKHEVEMALIQDVNKKHWDEHNKNIEWAKVKGEEVIIVK